MFLESNSRFKGVAFIGIVLESNSLVTQLVFHPTIIINKTISTELANFSGLSADPRAIDVEGVSLSLPTLLKGA